MRHFYFANNAFWKKVSRSFDTITIAVDVAEMLNWNDELNYVELVKQHAEHLVADRKDIVNIDFFTNETTTNDFLNSANERFFLHLESTFENEHMTALSDVYDDDESGEYFAIAVEYDNKHLLEEKIANAVAEFLGTNKEEAITEDTLKTAIAMYKLGN